MLETKQLILRPWQAEDAKSCYRYTKNPSTGPKVGQPVHDSVENSWGVIRVALSAPNTLAVVLKETTESVGGIGLMIDEQSNLAIVDDEGGIGYWIGEPYWGQGLVPKAMKELMRPGSRGCQLKTLWCGYFDGNEKFKRVRERCGLHHLHSEVRE